MGQLLKKKWDKVNRNITGVTVGQKHVAAQMHARYQEASHLLQDPGIFC